LARGLNGHAAMALQGLDLAGFKARAPWLGADLQTLRNVLRPAGGILPESREIVLPLGDGDALVGHYHAAADASGDKPLIVLIHGLTGSAASDYVMASAQHLLSLGYPLMRLDLRGAGASQRVSKGRYHAGRSEDLAAALRTLPAELADCGLVLVGYSLGANMLLKFLGEAAHGIEVLGAVSISAPFDLAISSRRIREPRNWLYHRHLVNNIKAEALAPTARLTPEERALIQNCRSIYEFDEEFIAPRHGFAGADDYHERCSARRYARGIEVPTLVIHALDDPWIPRAAYDLVDWGKLPYVRLVLTPSGGHVGFHDAASPIPWHDRAPLAFRITADANGFG
jgi:predicted alpha/beta-fold hydrolase